MSSKIKEIVEGYLASVQMSQFCDQRLQNARAKSCKSFGIIGSIAAGTWQWQQPGVTNGSLNQFQLLLLLGLGLLCLGGCQARCREEPARDCEAICDAAGGNCSIRALVLLPNDDGYEASLQRVLPILKVAEQQIRSTALIPPHIDFEWLAHDTKCDASLGVIWAMDGIIKQCAQIIFGPVCDYSLGKWPIRTTH